MTRRDAQARVLAAQVRLRELDVQLDRDVQNFKQRLRPSWLLAGGFVAGFATILFPRRFRVGFYTIGSIAWPITRLFAPTLLQSFLKKIDEPR
ncbi:MAG: hypothetical protein ABJB01_05725 [Rudaea sp.]